MTAHYLKQKNNISLLFINQNALLILYSTYYSINDIFAKKVDV
jgi:hypothetical protein